LQIQPQEHWIAKRSNKCRKNEMHSSARCGKIFRTEWSLDDLTIALSISIGSGVPWLIAIYSDSGARQLISNSVFGLLGAALVALAFDRLFSTYSVSVEG
jgi:hypothetical protein